MELPFEKKVCRYYRQKRYELVNLEQTQEIRIPESLPEAGRIIACWGQVVLQGKDWKSGSAGISGGVMMWVLYAPEDGGPVQTLEGWIPWKTTVSFSDGGEDGAIRAECVLQSADARIASGRKVILRAGVGVLVQILAPESAELYEPAELPEDMERLEQTYPLVVTAEAGEKSFLIDEDLELPSSMPAVDRLVYLHMEPELLDQKVMGSKAVFRGVGNLHLLYLDDRQKLSSQDLTIPFAQYVELDGEYDSDARIGALVCLTSLEAAPEPDGTLHIKCGMVSQYVINAVRMVQVLEDVYSPCRDVEVDRETVALPVWAQQLTEEQTLSADTDISHGTVLDVGAALMAPAVTSRSGTDTVTGRCGFQALIQSDDGTLSGRFVKAEASKEWKTACDTVCFSWLKGAPTCRKAGSNWRFETQTVLDLGSLCSQELEMVSRIRHGQTRQPDPERPSVIIRAKREDQSLWELAKCCGSTVGAIRKWNQLEGEPDGDRLLLIPVI